MPNFAKKIASSDCYEKRGMCAIRSGWWLLQIHRAWRVGSLPPAVTLIGWLLANIWRAILLFGAGIFVFNFLLFYFIRASQTLAVGGKTLEQNACNRFGFPILTHSLSVSTCCLSSSSFCYKTFIISFCSFLAP